MITKMKNTLGVGFGGYLPLKFMGEQIGKCRLDSEGYIVMHVESHEAEFKKAFYEPAMTGFSIEVNNEKIC